MALPKILQKLFANGGAGPKLRPEIMPIQTVDGYAPDAGGNVDTKRLPLSGGVMTGDIVFPIGRTYTNNNETTKEIILSGNTGTDKGALLSLRTTSSPAGAGCFVLVAAGSDGSARGSLYGTPDGILSWNSKNIVRSVNGVAADSNGDVSPNGAHVVETWHNGTSWYRKWSDGWIEQGGIRLYPNTISNSSFTDKQVFPTPFTTTTYTVIANGMGGADYVTIASSRDGVNTGLLTTTQFTFSIFDRLTNAPVIDCMMWYACGY